ncbi:unnamed protein product [marine sediment metagenome]|uniref:Uncharacterized protein n=1 Tax=marine sediment metagenome TaxID=412755 RepID=X0XJ17_9ZZZZ
MKKLIISLLVAGLLLCGTAFTAEPVEESNLTYLTHFAAGVAWDLNDFDNHSIAFISVVTWRDTINLDIGLVDFELVETEGELWWHELNPVVGISMDVENLGILIPQIEPLLGWIPEWVGIGAGFYTELDNFIDMDDVSLVLYATISWEW